MKQKQTPANESEKLQHDTASQLLSQQRIHPAGLPTLKELLESKLSSTAGKVGK